MFKLGLAQLASPGHDTCNEVHYDWLKKSIAALAMQFPPPPDKAKARQPWTSKHTLELVVARRECRERLRRQAAAVGSWYCLPFLMVWKSVCGGCLCIPHEDIQSACVALKHARLLCSWLQLAISRSSVVRNLAGPQHIPDSVLVKMKVQM